MGLSQITGAEGQIVVGFIAVVWLIWRLERNLLRDQGLELRRLRDEASRSRRVMDELRQETEQCTRDRAEDRVLIVELRADLAAAQRRIDHLEANQPKGP